MQSNFVGCLKHLNTCDLFVASPNVKLAIYVILQVKRPYHALRSTLRSNEKYTIEFDKPDYMGVGFKIILLLFRP